MKIVFFGTPELSCWPLWRIVDEGHAVVLAVTQPDAPAGRGRKIAPPPVKTVAQSCNIPVRQPDDISDGALSRQIAALKPDIGVVVSYGRLLPPEILRAPKYGFVNVHASLLPKYRGAGPIQAAITRGDSVTGVTVMRLDEGLDTGPIIDARAVAIERDDTAGTLGKKLMIEGADLLIDVLARIAEGSVKETAQDETEATYTRTLKKSDGAIVWNRVGKSVVNHIRAMNPWPGAFSFLSGENFPKPLRVVVLKAKVHHGDYPKTVSHKPGEVISALPEGILVATKKKPVVITRIQPAGKRAMSGGEFLRGRKAGPGDYFTTTGD